VVALTAATMVAEMRSSAGFSHVTVEVHASHNGPGMEAAAGLSLG
jgi:hypothetical protein